MLVVVFVAPFFTETARRYLHAVGALPGVRLAVVSCDPESALPPSLRRLVHAHYGIDDPLDVDQITRASRWIAARLGPLHRLLAVVEQLQVPVAEARERLDLPGMRAAEARRFRDKTRMKDTLAAAGVPVARHRLVRTEHEARRFAAEVGYPLVVKPPAGAASQSTFRAEDDRGLSGALREAEAAGGGEALLEEFIDGEERSFDALLLHGEVVFDSISCYHPTPLTVMRNPWIQGVVVVPREHHPPSLDGVRALGAHAVRALGLHTGMCHLEWFRRPDGRVVVSEVAARPAGAHIVTIIERAHDVDCVGAWARLMVFERFTPFPARRYAAGAAYLRGQGRGRVRAIHGLDRVERAVGHLLTDSALPRIGAERGPAFEGDGFLLLRHPETRVVEEALAFIVATVRVELG